MFFLKFGDLRLAGASPETLVKLEKGKVLIRPIAGTRGRSSDPVEDKALEKELLESEKECAEHVMLVDLARNDVGRVCRYGSVHVDPFMIVERYSHVMHIVSQVTGDLLEGLDAWDAFRAGFPAGTVSGAPKIRAMEIIDDLEIEPRGPYGGAVGYWGPGLLMDTCIAIRMIRFYKNRFVLQAGAGIVADSSPVFEYEEIMRKAAHGIASIKAAAGVSQ
jgi:anthranilate synthase component 1